MSRKTKIILARVLCLLISLLIVSSAIGTRVVIAANYAAAEDARKTATVAHTLGNVIQECLSDTTRQVDISDISNNSVKTLFKKGDISYAGPFVEHYIHNGSSAGDDKQDGKIWCREDATAYLRSFATLVLGRNPDDPNDIISDQELIDNLLCNNGNSGLLAAYPKGGGRTKNDIVEGVCGQDGYDYRINPDAEERLKELYENWAEDNPYAVSWSAMDQFNENETYEALYYDMVTACGGVPTDSKKDENSIPVTVYDSSGNLVQKYLNPAKENLKKQYYSSAFSHNTWLGNLLDVFSDEKLTCEEFAEAVSDYAEKYTDDPAFAQGMICYNKIANAMSSATNQAEIQKFRDLESQSRTSGDYSSFVKEDGDCVDMSVAISNETISDLDVNNPDNLIYNGITPDMMQTGIEEEDECYNNGTDEVGWVVCSVTKFLRRGITTLYDSVIIPFLELGADAFDTESPIFRAWQIFQQFANIVFVIFLLVIIFSQLTGYGIDNYGIKRMLPRLIVAAILVNLSYVICQLVVDLSNAVGYSINSMFENFALEAMDAANESGATLGVATKGGAVSGGIILGSLGIGGVSVAATAIMSGPTILLALIPALITAIISILFLFVVLGARRAAAVILVVLSPLAFVCYMLPNTKKIFDRWLSVFKAVFLVFPICGLLMGGGAFAGAVLWKISNGYLIGQILAALTTVVPFFFIPKILKGSLAAFGNLGATISNLGSTLGRGAANRLRNSDGFKAAQRRAAETVNRRRAGVDANGQVTRIGNLKNRFAKSRVGRFTGYSRLQAERLASAEKVRQTDISAQAELQGKANEYQLASDLKKGKTSTPESLFKEAFEKAQSRGDTSGMFAAIDQAKKAGVQASHMAQITRDSLDGGDFGNMSEGDKANFLREFGNRYGNDFLRKDFEQARWAQAGGMNRNGSGKANLSGYAAAGNIEIDDMKDDDVAALSGDRMSELMRAGKISRAQAQRVWGSNQNMDDTERLILAAYQQHGHILTKSDAQAALRSKTYRDPATGRMVSTKGMLERAPERVEVINVPHGGGGGGGTS